MDRKTRVEREIQLRWRMIQAELDWQPRKKWEFAIGARRKKGHKIVAREAKEWKSRQE
jgi:hypothetical protein